MAENPELTPEQQEVVDSALARHQRAEEDAIAQATGNTEEVPTGYNPDGTETEQLIGGKFKSAEDLLKAYQELEKKQSQLNSTEEVQEAPIVEENTQQTEESTNTSSLSPTEFDGYFKEYIETGKLSDSTYKDLESKGLSRDLVDKYIVGQEAVSDKAIQIVHDSVGGAEKYEQLVNWAKDSLTDEQKQEINSKLTSGNIEKAKEATEYLQYLHSKSNPQPPVRIKGESYSGNINGVKPFESRTEHSKATSNPLYGRDAKYTNMIDKRYLASRQAGLI